MSGSVGRGARWGMIVGAFLASAFTYYDIVANHKNMFGFAPVFVLPEACLVRRSVPLPASSLKRIDSDRRTGTERSDP